MRAVGHRGELFLAHVDFGRRRAVRRMVSAACEAQQHGDAALDVIANEEIVCGPDGDIDVSDGREAEEPPGARIARHDFPDGGQWQMQQLRIPCDREPDPPRLLGERRRFAKPRAGPREVGHVRPALARGD